MLLRGIELLTEMKSKTISISKEILNYHFVTDKNIANNSATILHENISSKYPVA